MRSYGLIMMVARSCRVGQVEVARNIHALMQESHDLNGAGLFVDPEGDNVTGGTALARDWHQHQPRYKIVTRSGEGRVGIGGKVINRAVENRSIPAGLGRSEMRPGARNGLSVIVIGL